MKRAIERGGKEERAEEERWRGGDEQFVYRLDGQYSTRAVSGW
jgi:hypothetical protein